MSKSTRDVCLTQAKPSIQANNFVLLSDQQLHFDTEPCSARLCVKTANRAAIVPRTNALAHTSKASPQTAPQRNFLSETAATLHDHFLSDCERDFWATTKGFMKCDFASKKDQRNGVLDYALCDAPSKER